MTLLIRVIIAFYEILKPTYNMKECLEAKKQTIQWGFSRWFDEVFFCFFSSFPFENDILLPKLFWPTVRKKCFSDREKLLKFEVEGREFAKFLRSLEQFIQTMRGQNNFL